MSLKYKVAHIIFNQFFRSACSGIQSAAGNAPAAVQSVIFRLAPRWLKQTSAAAKPGSKNGVFRCGKLKTDFQRVNLTWEQGKN